MKKKTLNVFLGIILGAAFLCAVVFAVRQYHIEGEEKETTKEMKVKVPEPLKPYQIGEEVQAGDFLWKVLEAELIEDYESLDDYYKLRGHLKAPEPNQQNPFIEEQRFLRVKFSVQNTNKAKDAEFSFLALKYANYWGEGIFENWELYNMQWYNQGDYIDEFGTHHFYAGANMIGRFFDGKCAISGGAEQARYFDDYSNITLAPEQTMEAECIIQFYEYGNMLEYGMSEEYEYLDTKLYLYDLCLEVFGPNAERHQYISLNIAPKHLNIYKTDIDNTYEEQRDITGMKAGQITNLEMKQYQESGYPMQREDAMPDARIETMEEEIVEENYFQKDGIMSTQIQKSEIIEWKDMPEAFRSQGTLQKMAERYQNKYGYNKDQLKVLLLDISYVGRQETNSEYFSIYENTWLFTRDNDKKRWMFGTADDWTVLSNDAHPERTGHINTEWIAGEQELTVQAAYILPPDIWEKEEALYFCSGIEYVGFCDAVVEVKLK